MDSLIEQVRETETARRAGLALNTSGIQPLDQRVLVLPDPADKKVGSIIIPDSTREQEKYAQVKGTLIASGANAWAEAKASAHFSAPSAGARIMFAKYGGIVVKGADGTDYRLMNDEDITATLEEG